MTLAEETVSTASFDELYTLYANDVLRVSYFYLGDRQRAEDVCQDVFVKLITTSPALQAGREKSWLLKVALNRCRDLWRAGWVKRVVLGHPAFELIPGPDEIGEMEEKQAIMGAVNRLPADFKDVVLLHYYQGYGIAEIAQMLGIAEGTVSSRLSRARIKLQSMMKGEDVS
ncbi:MAG: RNA polymerase sigma factor [Clostridia bacterium]|nr:RNA polymerase sigma factor [Clostridia bacterium]